MCVWQSGTVCVRGIKTRRLMWKPATWADLDDSVSLRVKIKEVSQFISGVWEVSPHTHLLASVTVETLQFLIGLPVQDFHIFTIWAQRGTRVEDGSRLSAGAQLTSRKWGVQSSSGLKNRQLISHQGSCRGRPAIDRLTWAATDEEQRNDRRDLSYLAAKQI